MLVLTGRRPECRRDGVCGSGPDSGPHFNLEEV